MSALEFFMAKVADHKSAGIAPAKVSSKPALQFFAEELTSHLLATGDIRNLHAVNLIAGRRAA